MDRLGYTWERIHEINPKIIYASLKGFGPGALENAKAYENIAQATGGAMSTTGFEDGPPVGDRRPDRGLGQRRPPVRGDLRRAVPAHAHRPRPARADLDARGHPQPLPREDARPAAARARAAGGVSEQGVRRLRPALRQRLRRRAARLGGALQADHGEGRERLALRRHPAPGLGAADAQDRPARPDREPGLRHARGAAASPAGHLRRDRGVDDPAGPSGRRSRSSTRSTSPAGRC